jgi:hypothetical protein
MPGKAPAEFSFSTQSGAAMLNDTCTTPETARHGVRVFLLLALLCLIATVAHAQLSGTYTIGPNGAGTTDYTSIESAISDLNASGVSGAVTFEITGGTYTAPTAGYTLSAVAGMSATNTVTFRPASGATVVVNHAPTSSSAATFNISGDYYILDGANTSADTGRNWKVINTGSSSGGVVRLINGATNNAIRNMNLIGSSTSSSGAIIYIGTATSSTGGNSGNTISSNTLGDSSGTRRSAYVVYMTGSSSAPNEYNLIDGNDIINYGNSTGYGIYVSSYNRYVKILHNRIRQIVFNSIGTKYGIYWTNTVNQYDTIAYNTIWNLNPQSASSSWYAIYISGSGSSPLVLHDNMITMLSNAGTVYGIYVSGSSTNLYIEQNSIHISGASSSSWSSRNIYMSTSSTVAIYNNVLSNTRRASGSNNNMLIYRASTSGTFSSDYNLLYAAGSSTTYGYRSGYYSSLASWQQSTALDMHSVSCPVTYQDTSEGDLHIPSKEVFCGEGMGTILGYTVDFDGELRDPGHPDIGADEGEFNGGGIALQYPDGGEHIAVDYPMTLRFTANRPIDVRVELSIDGGATWASQGTIAPTTVGVNTLEISLPDTVVSSARMRVISLRNGYEADTSDANFSLVHPIFTLLEPNGQDRLVPSDTTTIRWTSQFVPPTATADIDYSTDAGESWNLIASVNSDNLPATNSYDWIVPDAPSEQAIVRVRIPQSSSRDSSESFLTILPHPELTVLQPNGGEHWYGGEKRTISWNMQTIDYVRLEYSTDGGESWQTILDRIPAYLGSYEWMIPDISADEVLVRITSLERERFSDISDEPFSILQQSLQLLSPNGGEQFEMGEEITVNWSASNVSAVRVEYSANNGFTWQTVGSGIAAEAGSYSFTPPPTPTKLAAVRVIDEEHATTFDRSDRPFEILEARSIAVLTPAGGDMLVRGSTTAISWSAPRIGSVTIQYSPNGGAVWTTVASNVDAQQGSLIWRVPDAKTEQARIRIIEVGGSIIGESGLFSIVDPALPVVKVLSPNGGESYTEGDPIRILWSATPDLSQLALSYSTDGGVTWSEIARNIVAALGSYDWNAPAQPGKNYRIRIDAGSTSDISDADFTVERKLSPKLTMLVPNGGEKLTVGTVETIRWNEEDITDPKVKLELSTDNGSNWSEIAMVDAGLKSYDWTVPEKITAQGLVRVSTPTVSDQSNGTFEIAAKVLLPVHLVTPNGGENWMEKQTQPIRWEAPADISQVDLSYSTDGGQSWMKIAESSSISGTNSYNWTVPAVQTARALVRVRARSDSTREDISDAEFSITFSPLGVSEDAVAGGSDLMPIGAFPNPFATKTEIRWQQATSGDVTLRLFDGSGRLVRTIAAGRREAGTDEIEITADGMPTGLYYYELRSGAAMTHGSVMVVR